MRALTSNALLIKERTPGSRSIIRTFISSAEYSLVPVAALLRLLSVASLSLHRLRLVYASPPPRAVARLLMVGVGPKGANIN